MSTNEDLIFQFQQREMGAEIGGSNLEEGRGLQFWWAFRPWIIGLKGSAGGSEKGGPVLVGPSGLCRLGLQA